VRLRVRCPAKVNLHLQVLGKRPDGYHELRTIFAAVGIWDDLLFETVPTGTVELTVEPAEAAPAGPDNLVVKTARALAPMGDRTGGAHVVLHKAIPVAAGLGGGSADAAATLVGLARLWDLRREPHELAPVAAALGADVPFFLVGGVGWGVGRGSEVSPLPDLPAWWVVLLPGPQPIPTGDVYRALDTRALDGEADCEIYQWVEKGGELPFGRCRNDLQPTVVKLWPEVGGRLERVSATEPLLAMLSGSGGTVFGLYRDERDARRAAAMLAAFRPLVAPVLSREASLLRLSAVEG
jgi:4-diphosphocytidyl-2-C-methyl-D-erythritol kinase